MKKTVRRAELGLGCWAFGEDYWKDQESTDSVRTIHAALRGGITHYDTASGYGRGKSEQLLSQQIHRLKREVPRETLTIASKIFLPTDPSMVRPLVEKSLRRTSLDYLDILYIHWPDSSKDHRPFLLELKHVKEEGLIQHIGVSNFTPDLLKQAINTVEVDYCQFPLSLLYMRPLKNIIGICNQNSIRKVTYSPLFLGLLSGNHTTPDTLSPEDRRRDLFPFAETHRSHFNDMISLVKEIAGEGETTPGDIALRWVLSQDVDIVLSGARTKEQLKGSIASAQKELSISDQERLTACAAKGDALLPDSLDNPFFHRW